MREVANIEDYNTIVAENKPVLLDFYADWCGPCQSLMPTVEKLAAEHADDFVIAKVNVDNNRELAQKFGVRSIPALFFIQDGEVKEHLGGVQPKSLLESKIQYYSTTASL